MTVRMSVSIVLLLLILPSLYNGDQSAPAAAVIQHMSLVSSNERQTSVTYHQRCHPVRAPCAGGLLEFCDDGRCECRPYAQYSDLTGACLACPRAGVACAQCCAAYGHRCIDEQCVNCHDDGQTGPSGAGCRRTNHDDDDVEVADELPTERDTPDDSNATLVAVYSASQIALSVAMIMGLLAVVALMYRILSKPADRRRGLFGDSAPTPTTVACEGGHQSTGSSALRRLSQRLSLTSLQARVLQRMRDQPPKYSDATTTTVQLGTVAMRSADVPAIAMGAPPCYDNNGAYSFNDLPPPYTLENIGVPSTSVRTSSAVDTPTRTPSSDDQNLGTRSNIYI